MQLTKAGFSFATRLGFLAGALSVVVDLVDVDLVVASDIVLTVKGVIYTAMANQNHQSPLHEGFTSGDIILQQTPFFNFDQMFFI
ncbi:MAG: hypothetical protein JSY10_30190 [Paenibacillus sp.]|nr:hypothetical protein [Paenibacillus sp.]